MFHSILLEGLDGSLLVLPKTTALSCCVLLSDKYEAIPLVQEDYYYNIGTFYKENSTEGTRRFIELLGKITSQEQ